VPSIKAMLDPSIVAARTHGPMLLATEMLSGAD